MSLIDVAEELEYVPEQELINLSQNPNSRYPQFLVLSEVQRRNQMRKMYENQVAKQNQPMTTVADEKVMELAASSVMPNFPSPISNEMDQSPKGLLGMASNDVVEMQTGGITTGGLTASRKSIAESLGLIDEEGDVDLLQAATLASLAIPGTAALRGIYGLGKAGIGALRGTNLAKTRIGERIQDRFTSPSTAAQRQKQVDAAKKRFGLSSGQTSGTELVPVTSRVFDPMKTATTLSYPTAAVLLGLPLIRGDGEDTDEEFLPQTNNEISPELRQLFAETKMTEQDGQARREQGQNLAKLGFAILAAKNPSELGTNLYGLVDDMQKRKGTGLEGAQQAFYEARTEELQATIANMPEDNIRKSLDSVNAAIKSIQEGTGDESQLAGYETVRFALLQQLAKLKGLDISSDSLPPGATILD